MGLKETITNLLTNQRAMTQSELAESIYGALTNLVSNGVLLKSKVSPFTYTLSGTDVTNNEMTTRKKKDKRDVSGDVITNETLEEVESQVAKTVNYGAENDLITRCLARFPYNTDSDLVAMKIGLIDITNSTHLSHYNQVYGGIINEKRHNDCDWCRTDQYGNCTQSRFWQEDHPW